MYAQTNIMPKNRLLEFQKRDSPKTGGREPFAKARPGQSVVGLVTLTHETFGNVNRKYYLCYMKLTHRHTPIEGFEGLYEISTSKRIKILKPGRGKKNNPFVSPYKHKSAAGTYYWRVNLYKNGKQSQHFLHVLLAKAFVPGWKPGLEVNHKDGNGLNDNLDNLEWMTHSQNLLHAVHVLNRVMGKGMTPIKSRDCNGVIRKHKGLVAAAHELGVRARGIGKVLAGEQKTHGGYHFKRINVR